VKGEAGDDSLYGENGNHSLHSLEEVSGNDTLDGSAGTDTNATEKSIVGSV